MTSPKTAKSIKFMAGEAEEIYACLTDKLERVIRGDYRCTLSTAQPARKYKACWREENEIQKLWITGLKILIRKIGVDGKNLNKGLVNE